MSQGPEPQVTSSYLSGSRGSPSRKPVNIHIFRREKPGETAAVPGIPLGGPWQKALDLGSWRPNPYIKHPKWSLGVNCLRLSHHFLSIYVADTWSIGVREM